MLGKQKKPPAGKATAAPAKKSVKVAKTAEKKNVKAPAKPAAAKSKTPVKKAAASKSTPKKPTSAKKPKTEVKPVNKVEEKPKSAAPSPEKGDAVV